jgi:hypothetical protein
MAAILLIGGRQQAVRTIQAASPRRKQESPDPPSADVAAAQAALRRDPSIGAADWRLALEVFKQHKSYRGEA